MKHIIGLITIVTCLLVGINAVTAASSQTTVNGNGTLAAPTAVNTVAPLLILSNTCLNFNFKDKDAVMGMSMGAKQFNAGESLTITGEAPFTVEINPGGNSYPSTSFTYTFPKSGTYSIKIVTNPNTGIPQHFEFHCGFPQPVPAGATVSPTPMLAASPISFSQACNGLNFKGKDAIMGMNMGAKQFNAGETLTITGDAPFTVEINPGGNSYPSTSFTYTFPKSGIYSIKIVTNPDTGIPQHFELHCTIPQPLPAGVSPSPTPKLATTPISFSQACKGFNFKNHDTTTGMGLGAQQFNAGETLTITGDGPFTVEITPGGTSVPLTSFTYTFPATGMYSIKIVSSPTGKSRQFELHCTIPQPGVSPTPTWIAVPPVVLLQVPTDAKVCRSFKFVSVKPYGPARISWMPSNHAANDSYGYRVIITALTSDHITLPLVDGLVNESTAESPLMKATFPYALPANKRIQSYTVTLVAGSDCTISMTLLATLPTPIPPTSTPIPTQAPQQPQSHTQPQAPGKPKAASCPAGTTGDPSKGIPCIAMPK